MPVLRLPVVAVLCGAGLLGFSIGGVTSVGDAPPQVQAHHASYATGCPDREREL